MTSLASVAASATPANFPVTARVSLGLHHISRSLAAATPELTHVENLHLPYLNVPLRMRMVDIKAFITTRIRRRIAETNLNARQRRLLAGAFLDDEEKYHLPKVPSAALRRGNEFPDPASVSLYIVADGQLVALDNDDETAEALCTQRWDRKSPLIVFFKTTWSHTPRGPVPADTGSDLVALMDSLTASVGAAAAGGAGGGAAGTSGEFPFDTELAWVALRYEQIKGQGQGQGPSQGHGQAQAQPDVTSSSRKQGKSESESE